MAVDSNGNLYTWGCNNSGQLGNGTYGNTNTPTKITLAEGVKPTQIICLYSTSIAKGDDGKLYAWGTSLEGQSLSGNPMAIDLTEIYKN